MNLFFLIIGLTLLIFGAELIIRGSVSFGRKLKVSLFAIGVVIVAGGTSLPELASSINAVLIDHADLAVGAVVGSNIANLILVMAATSFLIPISNINQNQINQAWINIGLAIILIFMSFFILSFNYLFGILSICLLFIIMFMQIKQGSLDVSEVEEKGDYSLFISIIFIVGGIILLIYGSDLFVESAINIANQLNIPEAIIGVSLVAFGTSLPELATTTIAAVRRQGNVALGNVIGSNMFNLLAIIGIAAFVAPIPVDAALLRFDLWIMLAASLLLIPFVFTKLNFNRIWGAGLTLLYMAYLFMVLL